MTYKKAGFVHLQIITLCSNHYIVNTLTQTITSFFFFTHTHTHARTHTHTPAMAPVTLYDASVGLFVKSLETLSGILRKAKEHSPSDADSFVTARLAEDMLPFSFQVQMVSNASKKTLERLVPQKGPYPVWEDNEKTLDELIARVDKTLALLKTIKPEDLAGKEDEVVEVKLGSQGSATVEGKGYALGYALPNMFFHLAMAYAILRSRGVPVGKMDYLAPYFSPYILSRTPAA